VLTRVQHQDEIAVEIEANPGVEPTVVERLPALVAAALADAHEGLRFRVQLVAEGTLPIFELKARRLLDQRAESPS
jgi:phenylacetate-CoA ligase